MDNVVAALSGSFTLVHGDQEIAVRLRLLYLLSWFSIREMQGRYCKNQAH